MSKQTVLILILVPLLLMIVWFRNGNILATAEGGIPFNNLENHKRITQYAWADPALGNSTGIITASHPTYVVLSYFEQVGIPGFITEALFFYILFVSAGVGIYFFAKLLFPELPEKYLIVVVIFYWFNPFTMVNIWHRFLYNFMVFYSFLPLAAAFYLRGIIEKKIGYVFIIALLSGVFSYALTSTPFNVLIWLVFFYITVFYCIIDRTLEKKLYNGTFFVLSLLLFVLVNAWWLSQLLAFVYSSGFDTAVGSFFNQDGNSSTLDALSVKLGNFADTIRLYHGEFYSKVPYGWIKIYTSLPLILFSFVYPLVGLAAILFKKSRQVVFLIILFVIGLLMAKGNNPPFGEVFDFIFIQIPFFQVFRNPFEKFGFILPLAMSPLIGFGLFRLISKISRYVNSKKIEKILFISSFTALIIFYGLPFFTSAVFNISKDRISFNNDYEVKVPIEYQRLDEYLKSDTSLFRFMVLPISGEGITQKWDKGYSGVEASSTLFTRPSISFNTTIPYFYEITKEIQRQFLVNPTFFEIANRLVIKYYVLRQDIDFVERSMYSPTLVQGILQKKVENDELVKKMQFDKLSLWENKRFQVDYSVLSNTFISSNIATDLTDLTLDESTSTALLIDKEMGEKLNLFPTVKIINPRQVFYFPKQLIEGDFRNQDFFPYISIIPGSNWHSFLLKKEQIELNTMGLGEKKLPLELFYMGKRLSELNLLQELRDSTGMRLIILKLYKSQFEDFKQNYYLLENKSPNQIARLKDWVRLVLKSHQIFLDKRQVLVDVKINQQIKQLDQEINIFLKKVDLIPRFPLISNTKFPIHKRRISQFTVDSSGEFELIVSIPSGLPAEFNDLIPLQIDDTFFSRPITKRDDGKYSLGKFTLHKGAHEIGLQGIEIELPTPVLSRIDDELVLPVPDYNPYTNYSVAFEVGQQLKNSIKTEFRNYNLSYPIDSYQVDIEKKVVDNMFRTIILYSPSVQSTKAEVVFTSSDYITDGKDIKNITLTRVIPLVPKLIEKKEINKNYFARLNVKKVNPTKYEIEVPVTAEKTILTLSQLYSSGWVLYDQSGKNYSEHILVNGYANGWVIPAGEKRQMTAFYHPQTMLNKAKMVSVISTWLCLIGGGYMLWRQKI